MQKNAKFNSLTMIPATTKLFREKKNERLPVNVLVGVSGSFIVEERTKLILSLECETGEIIEKDIYLNIRTYMQIRITRKFCKQLESMMKDFNFLVEDGKILNLDQFILKII